MFNTNVYNDIPDWWNSVVINSGGVFCSGYEWASFYKNSYIGVGKYIEVIDDGKRVSLILIYDSLIGGTILMFLPKFFLNFLFKFRFLRSYSSHIQPVIVNEDVLLDENYLIKLADFTIKFIVDLAKKEHKSIMPFDYICFSKRESLFMLRNMLNSFVDDIEFCGTTRLYFDDKVIGDIYKKFDESIKSSIRKCIKLDLSIKKIDINEVSVFYDGLRDAWKNMGLAVNSYKYYYNLKSYNNDNIQYYVCYSAGRLVCGSGVMFFGKTAMEFSMFVTKYGKDNKIPGGDIVKIRIIEDCINGGYEFLDFNMIAVKEEDTLDDKKNNINFYKLKWGGDIIYGIKIVKLNVFLDILRRIKNKIIGH